MELRNNGCSKYWLVTAVRTAEWSSFFQPLTCLVVKTAPVGERWGIEYPKWRRGPRLLVGPLEDFGPHNRSGWWGGPKSHPCCALGSRRVEWDRRKQEARWTAWHGYRPSSPDIHSDPPRLSPSNWTWQYFREGGWTHEKTLDPYEPIPVGRWRRMWWARRVRPALRTRIRTMPGAESHRFSSRRTVHGGRWQGHRPALPAVPCHVQIDRSWDI